MILRRPQWARGIFPMHVRAGLWGIDFVSAWHFVPLFGVYLKWNGRWGLRLCWRLSVYR